MSKIPMVWPTARLCEEFLIGEMTRTIGDTGTVAETRKFSGARVPSRSEKLFEMHIKFGIASLIADGRPSLHLAVIATSSSVRKRVNKSHTPTTKV